MYVHVIVCVEAKRGVHHVDFIIMQIQGYNYLNFNGDKKKGNIIFSSTSKTLALALVRNPSVWVIHFYWSISLCIKLALVTVLYAFGCQWFSSRISAHHVETENNPFTLTIGSSSHFTAHTTAGPEGLVGVGFTFPRAAVQIRCYYCNIHMHISLILRYSIYNLLSTTPPPS